MNIIGKNVFCFKSVSRVFLCAKNSHISTLSDLETHLTEGKFTSCFDQLTSLSAKNAYVEGTL